VSHKHPFSTRRGVKTRNGQLRREPRCEMCLSIGVVTATETVDHRIALNHGGSAYDPANLRSLCLPCHKQRHGARPKVRTDPKTGLPTLHTGV
jgi:5-methylcytosine-specific restriction endonuclease McrA